MCQGCEDYWEFERMADSVMLEELRKMMAQPIDMHIFTGDRHR